MRIVFIIVSLFILLLESCIDLSSNNTNEKIIEVSDRTHVRKAILFIKNGGATVGDSYHISIFPYQEMLKDSDIGNAFIADNQDGAIPSDTSEIRLNWIGSDTLKVSFSKTLRIFKFNKNVDKTVVLYDSLDLK